MTHSIVHTEEWEEDYCDACGHAAWLHYDTPEDVLHPDGAYSYTAEGCMVIVRPDSPGRWLRGDNPYKRCPCLKCE